MLSAREAIEYLSIPPKHFKNYTESSCEIPRRKIGARWYYKQSDLDEWNLLRSTRVIKVSMKEYTECFKFAILMAYSSNATRGTGIRGTRSEVQKADDFIFGILAEYGFQKFLRRKFGIKVKLDTEVHPAEITPQDIVEVYKNDSWRAPKKNIAIKSSKYKSCFNVIDPLEYENAGRKSDYYVFVRVGLPSDHLFRILRNHWFFKDVKKELERLQDFRKIEALDDVEVWICGYSLHRELRKVREIPGQEFDGYRYVASVGEMHNSDNDWLKFKGKL